MIKSTKLDKKDIIYLILLLIFSIGYFFRLFFPKESLFLTPDVYSSDLIHINYSLKYVLSEFLKNNQLPYWTWNTGGGFPLIGESQIGAFYLPNLIMFKIFQFNFAYSLGYIFTFFISSFGCYLFFRRFINNKYISFISSLIFTYSAPMFVQISHYNLLQSYSLIPIIFYCLESFLQTNIKKLQIIYFLLLSLLLTQQFYAGYVMTTFMTFLFIFLYFFLKLTLIYKNKFITSVRKVMIFVSILGIVVFTLSLNQLIPLIEFANLSVRSNNGTYLSTANSLNPLMFLTYIKFDFFNSFSNIQKTLPNIINFAKYRNIFWDGNLYIGLFPIILSTFFIIIYRKKIFVKFFILLFLISTLFAMGQDSPLNFLYGLPPLSLFRTPFRFTIFITFFLITFIAISTNYYFEKTGTNKKLLNFKTYLLYIFSFITIFNLYIISFKYHKTVTLNEFKQVTMVNNPNSQIYTFGNELVWYQTLLYKKWFDKEIYLFFMKDSGTYLNEIYHTNSQNIFFASFFSPKKQFYFDNFIRLSLINKIQSKGISFTFDPTNNYKDFLNIIYNSNYSIPLEVVNSLKIKGVKYFVTPLKIKENNQIRKIKEESIVYEKNIYYMRIYEILSSYPKAYFVNDYAYINTIEDAIKILKERIDVPTFGFSEVSFKKNESKFKKISDYSMINNQIKFKIFSNNKELIVYNGSFYPGIKVYVNNVEVKVYEVNFNQITFNVKPGNSDVKIVYQPNWLFPSLLMSFASHSLILMIIVYLLIRNKKISH